MRFPAMGCGLSQGSTVPPQLAGRASWSATATRLSRSTQPLLPTPIPSLRPYRNNRLTLPPPHNLDPGTTGWNR